MDNYQALQSFWESFGVDAYDEQTVFDEGNLPAFPHITYEAASGGYLNSTILAANLWHRTTSWGWLDTGYLWIKLPETTPFDSPEDSGDDAILRIRMNIEVDFLTT